MEGIDTKALPLMIELLKYGRDHSEIVILEGIMYEEWYEPLFQVADELYGKIYTRIILMFRLKRRYDDIIQGVRVWNSEKN